MALARLTAPNPSLEKLRADVEGGTNPDLAADLIKLTSNIHVKFLFTREAKRALQLICIRVGAVPTDGSHSNWKDFGDCLSLTYVQMQNIENYFQILEGPVIYVLAIYAQGDDATLGKVINALQQIDRQDIIIAINDEVHKIVRYVRSLRNSEDSAFYSDDESRIIEPKNIVVKVPLVLCAETNNVFEARKPECNIPNVVEENDSPLEDNALKNKLVKFTVMLTFANDGVAAANRIAELLRSHNPRIGVVILKDQTTHMFQKDLGFIHDCIEQVDAVFPILTNEYMERINNRGTDDAGSSLLGIDQKHVKYIYDQLVEEFKNNGWKNSRVGCIIPHDAKFSLPKLTPILRVWFKEENIEECLALFLSNKLKKC